LQIFKFVLEKLHWGAGIHAFTDILAAVNPDVTSVAVISFISVIPECTLGYNEFNTLALAGC